MNAIPPSRISPAPLGQHVIAEFYGADALFDAAAAEPILREAAGASGAVVLDVNLHDFGDREGFTGVALLAESHISIHTWPEHGYAAIDIFMCGDCDTSKGLDVLRTFFAPTSESVTVLKRGLALCLICAAAFAIYGPVKSSSTPSLAWSFAKVFLHGDAPHLVFNLAILFLAGQRAEPLLGPARMVALVLLCAIVGTTIQFVLVNGNFAGISGPVYGIAAFAILQGRTGTDRTLRVSGR